MNTPLSPNLLREIETSFDKIKSLPFPVHVSDYWGNFLFANQAACKLFRLPDEADCRNFNIIGHYESPAEREYLLRELQKSGPEHWAEELTARLNIGDEQYKVRFASWPFFEDGSLKAMLSIANKMSIIEWFEEFENDLEMGLFEVDEDFMVVDCNHALMKMLGVASLEEMRSKKVSDFLWNTAEADALFDEIKSNKTLKKRQLKLRRKDDAMVIVNMSCSATSWEEGQIARVKGIVRDITFEIIQQVNPVGLFLVTGKQEGKDIFSRVNDTFAHIHGHESADEIHGLPANQFQQTTNDNYLAALNKAEKLKQPLLDHFMEITDLYGKKRHVVVNARYVYGEAEKIRVGAVYDVTDHVGRNRRVLEANFSAILHTYLATVNGLRDTLIMLGRAHGEGFLKEGKYLDRSAALAEVGRHRKRFEDLLTELAHTFEIRGFDPAILHSIQKAWQNINKPREEFDNKEKDSASWIRRNLIEVNKHLRKLRDLQLKRELTKELRSEIEEMTRLTSIVSISISIDELNERIPDFNFFRNYLLRGDTADTDVFKLHNLLGIISGQVQKLEEFASSRGVVVYTHFNPRENVPIHCRADLGRAFYSLVHNAIKYSWSKTGSDRQAHVDISIEKNRDEIEIIIENWGVAIRKDELENEAIMQFGRRGKEADDRGRSGTGIGLYDAREIIQQHSGKLRLSSEPTLGNPADVYSNPFITRAYIILPIAK
jgi:PAS domain S-box-containing protein